MNRRFIFPLLPLLPATAIGLGLVHVSSNAGAALSSVADAQTTFDASGPAGMKIEGTTPDLQVTDDGTNVVISVPLVNLTTGIALRDHHMKEKYLEVPKYPAAILTIARAGLKLPAAGEKAEADASGTVTLHGQTRPVSIHYDAKRDGATIVTHGQFHINMNDFGITVPSYLGVTVKPDVQVSASFRVAGS